MSIASIGNRAGPPAVVPLASMAPQAMDALLARQQASYLKSFGAAFAHGVETLKRVLREGAIEGFVDNGPTPEGYALVARTAEADVLGALWVRSGRLGLAHALVERVRLDARRRGRRLEAQDLIFGEGDLREALDTGVAPPRRRFYASAETKHAALAPLPSGIALRELRAGDLLPAASVALRAFARSPEVEIAASYRSLSGCLERLSLAVQGHAWGDFAPSCSSVAVDARRRVVGFALVTRMDRRIGHLVEMAVAPELGRRGTGAALLQRALDSAPAAGIEELSLCVSEDNAAARALYRAHGFRDRRSFYAHVLEPGKYSTDTRQNLPAPALPAEDRPA